MILIHILSLLTDKLQIIDYPSLESVNRQIFQVENNKLLGSFSFKICRRIRYHFDQYATI